MSCFNSTTRTKVFEPEAVGYTWKNQNYNRHICRLWPNFYVLRELKGEKPSPSFFLSQSLSYVDESKIAENILSELEPYIIYTLTFWNKGLEKVLLYLTKKLQDSGLLGFGDFSFFLSSTFVYFENFYEC